MSPYTHCRATRMRGRPRLLSTSTALPTPSATAPGEGRTRWEHWSSLRPAERLPGVLFTAMLRPDLFTAGWKPIPELQTKLIAYLNSPLRAAGGSLAFPSSLAFNTHRLRKAGISGYCRAAELTWSTTRNVLASLPEGSDLICLQASPGYAGALANCTQFSVYSSLSNDWHGCPVHSRGSI